MNGFCLITSIAGFIFVLAGLILQKFPPGNINYIFGYRTYRSIRNAETWKEGNKTGAKNMIFCGIFLLFSSGLIYLLLPDLGESSTLAGLAVIIVSVIIMLWRTENHLENTFDKEGNRKA